MTEEKYIKALKNAQIVAIVVLVIVVVCFVILLVTRSLTPVRIISTIVQIGLLIATFIGMRQQAMYGPICGIIVSILMILALDLIDIIIGVCYLIDNINIMRYMKNQ